ncbi:MAG TPA: SH3 domain-containing protein [Thermoanaerobaculia bacterium]|nr:SH3 domain-containing protein [Thermoanaerobaculia bacterium]
MRYAALLPLLLLFACGEDTEPFLERTDTREPVKRLYVTGAELPVHQSADEAAPVITTYQRGERVAILVEQGEWVELRVGDRSGWARAEHLGAAEKRDGDNPTVRFEKMPPSVTSLTARGEIYIEADVNTDGDVINTRILVNTTGSEALAHQNETALRQAKFYPIVQSGERRAFKYYYRVTY